MKTIISFAIKLCFIVLACSALLSCDPREAFIYDMLWRIKNDTNENIYFRVSDDESVKPVPILSGEIGLLCIRKAENADSYDFNVMERVLFGECDKSVYIFLETDGLPVKIWRAKDKDKPGKQLFNESSWEAETLYNGDEQWWTFHIEQSDLE